MGEPLPYDIARCEGRTVVAKALAGDGVYSVPHGECRQCRRREPGAPDRPQPYTLPPQFVDGKCPSRISP